MNSLERLELMQQRLQNAFAPTVLHVIDDSHEHVGHLPLGDTAGHYTVEISREGFSNQSLVQIHRHVYDVLIDLMPHEIHALRIKVLKE